MKKRSILYSALFLSFLFAVNANAQRPAKWTSAEIHHNIKKLNVLGSALYVAAHPDDENTRLISYLANELKVNTAYLSLTRGDGGQNLIGTEIKELLGVIRTQELLAARRIDGGNQMFSRANDFGYSKHPDETLNMWNKDEVLADVVWGIRKWQPDIIINRFDIKRAGKTHGHHTSSAVLSDKAWDMVGDANAFPEQLEYVQPWQPRRLYYNTSWWRYGGRDKFAKVDKSQMAIVDIGVYYPLKGKSNTEIAAESRSQHRCQGMGNTGTRGSQNEYLEMVHGDLPSNRGDLFDGIDITWKRVKGGAPIGKILAKVEANFKPENPAASVPNLLKALKMIQALPDGYWKRVKLAEIKEIITQCMGLYVEAVADDYSATAGEAVDLTLEIINRSEVPAYLSRVEYLPTNEDSTLNLALTNNQGFKVFKTITIPANAPTTNPYWLNKMGEKGMYTVESQQMRGLPETPRALQVHFDLRINDVNFRVTKDVVYKKNDRVDGEVYRPFEIVLPIYGNFQEDVNVFTEQGSKTIKVVLTAGRDNVSGQATLDRPNGWEIKPEFIDFNIALKGGTQTVEFELFPPENASEGLISPIADVNGEKYTRKLVLIEYDHIPTQTVALPSEAKVVKIDLKKAGDKVAYIMGAGDKIPESLEQVGYQVDILADADITKGNLKQYDAVIVGIRAYNTNERMKFHQPILFDYVKNGGTLINQYQTTWGLKIPKEEMTPYPMTISRQRVSVEEAEVRFLQPNHEVLNHPNKITDKDFENWVQERGLYFASEWDDAFVPILSANDPGEPPRDGGMLVAKYGNGFYIYSGYSWFRELPAGVPGAYRLFTNMISIGKNE